jgi:hypothetical protein
MLLTGSRSCGKGTDCAVAEGGSKSDAWPALRCPHRSSPSSVMCVPNTDLLAEAERYLNTARPRGRRLHPRGSRSRTRARHIKPVLPRRSGPIDQGLPDRRPRPSGLRFARRRSCPLGSHTLLRTGASFSGHSAVSRRVSACPVCSTPWAGRVRLAHRQRQ